MNCNDSQKAAIIHERGPALILAGPGSGKTFTITMRTKYLIDNLHIKEENILVVTFTKAAAAQMKERFLKLCQKSSTRISFGTFHSIFFNILRNAYNYNASNVIAESDKRDIIKKLLNLYEIEDDDEAELVENIISEISRVKGDGIFIDNYYSKSLGDDIFRKVYKDYNSLLIRNNKIDFDDMLVMCYELLSERKDVLRAWQGKFKYILVDEFQDINMLQYKVIKMLAKPENNLFAVGDDDQSIYGFRGARPELMRNFEKDFPNLKKVVLAVNYRSTEDIIKKSQNLISHNSLRFDKKINGIKGEGVPVCIKEYGNLNEQNNAIINEIQMYVNKGGCYKDIAVLYRTNLIPRNLIEKTIEYNIPFAARDVIPNIYEHFIFKDIKAYIDIAMGSRKRSDFLAIANKPKRYISRDCLDRQEISFERLKALYDDKEWMLKRLDKFEDDIELLRNLNPFAAITYIRRGIGYDDYINEYADYRKIGSEDLFDILAQIHESSRDFNDYEEWFDHIKEYSEMIKHENLYENRGGDLVTFSTMHSAKGLEYDIVYIIDACEGITPHNKSVLDADIEEERRMFYVAMTRAKKVLNICFPKERFNKKQTPSRFIEELKEDVTK